MFSVYNRAELGLPPLPMETEEEQFAREEKEREKAQAKKEDELRREKLLDLKKRRLMGLVDNEGNVRFNYLKPILVS
jgi:hypothetical protein